MFFKETRENNARYLKPIFSDFEKEYLLSEIDMIIKNGGDKFVFDNSETNRISVYFTGRYCIGFCSGVLSEVLWTLITTKLIDDETYYGSYLDFAIEGGSNEPKTGHMTLNLDSKKIRQIFLEKDLFKLLTGNRSNSSKDFIESVEQ